MQPPGSAPDAAPPRPPTSSGGARTTPGTRLWRSPQQRAGTPRDQRGDYAIFFAVIATGLLLFSMVAIEAPRLITSRQHAVFTANDAARVAAATIAAGGTVEQAEIAAEDRVEDFPQPYGALAEFNSMRCTGNHVEVTVLVWYRAKTLIAVYRDLWQIVAIGAAEAVLVGPDGEASELAYLPECPLEQ